MTSWPSLMKMRTWALHVAGRQSAAPLPPCGSLKSMCLIWTPVELETTGHARIVGNKWWWWFHRSPCGPNKIFIYPHIKKREPSSRYKKTLRYPKEKILKDLVEKIKSITDLSSFCRLEQLIYKKKKWKWEELDDYHATTDISESIQQDFHEF